MHPVNWTHCETIPLLQQPVKTKTDQAGTPKHQPPLDFICKLLGFSDLKLDIQNSYQERLQRKIHAFNTQSEMNFTICSKIMLILQR